METPAMSESPVPESDPPVDPPSDRVGETASGQPLYTPRHMPSDERLAGIARGLARFGLVHTVQATITEAAAIERSWMRLAQLTEVPLPANVVALVQRRTHRMLERRKSGAVKHPTKSPERYALDEVYAELSEGTLKYREGVISR